MSDTTSYAAEAAHDVATTTVTAGVTQGGATVAIAPTDADPATAGPPGGAAEVGRTVVEVKVTAPNGITRLDLRRWR